MKTTKAYVVGFTYGHDFKRYLEQSVRFIPSHDNPDIVQQERYYYDRQIQNIYISTIEEILDSISLPVELFISQLKEHRTLKIEQYLPTWRDFLLSDRYQYIFAQTGVALYQEMNRINPMTERREYIPREITYNYIVITCFEDLKNGTL